MSQNHFDSLGLGDICPFELLKVTRKKAQDDRLSHSQARVAAGGIKWD
jgi:hypothetical protein